MKFFHWWLKNKTLDANERTAYQLLELFDETKDKPKSYRCTTNLMQLCFQKTLFCSV